MKTYRLLAVVLLLVAVGSQCKPSSPGKSNKTLVQEAASPSALLIALDTTSPAACLGRAKALIAATARTSEHVVVLDQGQVIASSVAPRGQLVAPAPPEPSISKDANDEAKVRYRREQAAYPQKVDAVSAELKAGQRQQVEAWVSSIQLKLPAPRRVTSSSLSTTLLSAAATISSWTSAGVDLGNRKVLVVLGVTGVPLVPSPVVPQDLQGLTVVVADFPGIPTEQAAWQAGLVRAGANQAVVLTSGTGTELIGVVNNALDGVVTETLTSAVLFSGGQSTLQPAATLQLGRVRQLLITHYPTATAVVNGYTDDLPTPQGNQALSQARAQTVRDWLIAHGVTSDRLQAVGHGEEDSAAPNHPAGQPANRRVDIVINPSR